MSDKAVAHLHALLDQVDIAHWFIITDGKALFFYQRESSFPHIVSSVNWLHEKTDQLFDVGLVWRA